MSAAPLRVLVCGGRDYDDLWAVHDALDEAFYGCQTPHAFRVIQGGAAGADALARIWCQRRSVRCDTYTADWQTHGRAAGPLRNARMIAEGRPDLVVAFPGGRGTADMVRQARAAGVTVREVEPPVPARGATPPETEREG